METSQIGFEHQKDLIDLNKNLQSSGRWFYWVGALSIINTLIMYFGGGVSFIVGLGITQFIDGVVYEASSIVKLIALLVNILISGSFGIFGCFALKQNKWPFMIGMTLYFMDALLFLFIQDWLSIGFHAFVLLSLFAGIRSINKVEKIQQQQSGGLSSIEKEIMKT